MLPEWWATELESQPAAVAEAAGYIAIRCGLDVASVFKPYSPIAFKYRAIPQAQKTDGTTESVPLVAQGLAANVAEMVAYSLASLALESGKRDGVDPGFIALNYSWEKIRHVSGKTAMKIIEPKPNAPEKINSYLLKYLDFDRISSDRQEYLELVTGVDVIADLFCCAPVIYFGMR